MSVASWRLNGRYSFECEPNVKCWSPLRFVTVSFSRFGQTIQRPILCLCRSKLLIFTDNFSKKYILSSLIFVFLLSCFFREERITLLTSVNLQQPDLKATERLSSSILSLHGRALCSLRSSCVFAWSVNI